MIELFGGHDLAQAGEANRGVVVAAAGGARVPGEGGYVVELQTLAVLVKITKVGLSGRESLFGGCLREAGGTPWPRQYITARSF